MNPDIAKRAELLDEQYAEMSARRIKAAAKLAEEFKKMYEAAEPIMQVMRKHSMYYRHPDLDPRYKTTHGPIVGRNDGLSELYYFDGHFVNCINARDGKPAEPDPLHVELFCQICDEEFALRGLQWIFTCSDEIISGEKRKAERLEEYAQDIKRSREG
ncbi:MAG: hypothetical protein LBI19_07350 [Oscillospiraceae bacterium]|jgi:hypothetical protein|nr:hypothetical protein [Oscillospiraceae bacterium]